MEENRQIILFGAGEYGARALLYFGKDRVFCFADNDEAKHHKSHCGKKVISPAELANIHQNYQVVMSLAKWLYPETKEQLAALGICSCPHISDLVSNREYPVDERLAKLKNTHKGESCFVVGNGPSLTMENLNTLHQNGVFSMASNKIYHAFAHTAWRPQVYVTSDWRVAYMAEEELYRMEVPLMLINDPNCDLVDNYLQPEEAKSPMLFYQVKNSQDNPAINEPEFSVDLARYCCAGFTVTYAMLQWCVYMGFTSIYLLGMDHSYYEAQSDKRAHFYGDQQAQGTLFPKYMDRAYASAKKHANANGVRILNATRGGHLEVFERVEFDSLFVNK